ncbi:hypothetical protein NPIL_101681 [Nephila pilipes]|uniref:C2H2-type domain-containing protein n=1 Tax=Nephila pilipes TaxID=299642 RepID=A0A8X6Q686_NEPPI|nr:hypothetical protein NPIL_101681 [Nephila pilipes]
MEFRCDYCNEVFYSIEHYLRHKYITHDGPKLRPLIFDDRLTWQSFLERFAAWSKWELANRSTRRQVNANERVDTPAKDDNLYFGEVHFNQIPIRQGILTQGGTSSSVFDRIERHNYSQLSGQQMHQQINTNQLHWAPSSHRMESYNLQMRPGTSSTVTFSGIPHLNRPTLTGFSSLLTHTQNPIQPSIVNRSTTNCMKSNENSVAIFREPLSTEVRYAESSFAKQAQYHNIRKHYASESHPEKNLVEFKKQHLNSKCSVQSLNNQTALHTEDHIENLPSDSHASQTKLKGKSRSAQRSETQTGKKSHISVTVFLVKMSGNTFLPSMCGLKSKFKLRPVCRSAINLSMGRSLNSHMLA